MQIPLCLDKDIIRYDLDKSSELIIAAILAFVENINNARPGIKELNKCGPPRYSLFGRNHTHFMINSYTQRT